MTSKAQQAKEAQGYKKTSNQCKNCYHFASDRIEVANPFYAIGTSFYTVVKNKRCTLGNFPVLSTASCFEHTEPDTTHKEEK